MQYIIDVSLPSGSSFGFYGPDALAVVMLVMDHGLTLPLKQAATTDEIVVAHVVVTVTATQ